MHEKKSSASGAAKMRRRHMDVGTRSLSATARTLLVRMTQLWREAWSGGRLVRGDEASNQVHSSTYTTMRNTLVLVREVQGQRSLPEGSVSA